jgi:hypothetical protein
VSFLFKTYQRQEVHDLSVLSCFLIENGRVDIDFESVLVFIQVVFSDLIVGILILLFSQKSFLNLLPDFV